MKNPKAPMAYHRKFKIGDIVAGLRNGSKYHLEIGVLKRTYVTLNEVYRNPAYVVGYQNGIERSFQSIRKVEPEQVEKIRRERNHYIKKR